MFLENQLASHLSLNGAWSFQLHGHPPATLPVPSAWEAHLPDKITDGPALYSRSFSLPSDWFKGQRLVFEALAISYAATVRVNGREAGTHTGLWSPFQFDITHLAQPGDNHIEIEVWKPGRRYPLRESLAGFLGDVCTMFGGIWQAVSVRAFTSAIANLRVLSEAGEQLRVAGRADNVPPERTTVLVEVVDAEGQMVRATEQPAAGDFEATVDVRGLRRWYPAAPALYTVIVSLHHAGVCLARAERCLGLRAVRASGGQAWLDDQPLHLRGVLDWGWHPDSLSPTPTREALAQQFAQMRSLGFNLVKLCLYVPDEATFAAADEAGVYLWLEMPLWLPKVTPELRALALREYEAVFRRLHHHPSIVVLSLGCELNADAEADFLQALTDLARAYFPNVLHCDNSGSAEAYGGVTTALSDFYDYHFYTDPHFFTPLVEHFDRAYRPARPWLFGEFCDADTMRDFNQLQPEPWWLTESVSLERDDYLSMRAYRERLAAALVTDGGARLVRLAQQQATAIRQYILEQTRAHNATGGYVISGWTDTPITTSGIVDDLGRLKFQPDDWQRFNADRVLVLDRERRRRWIGGDRPAFRDPFTWRAGERLELHVLLSNGAGALAHAPLRWQLTTNSGAVVSQGEMPSGEVSAGAVAEVAALPLPAPALPDNRPVTLTLALKLNVPGAAPIANRWQLWWVPPPKFPAVVQLDGNLAGRLDLRRVDRSVRVVTPGSDEASGPWLAGWLTPQLMQWVGEGGQAVLWQVEADARFTRAVPFWREAIHTFEPHPLWDAVPHAGHADLRFFSLASDLALDLAALQAALGSAATLRPVWRRFDARSLYWLEYLVAVEYGRGHLWVTTLSLRGGLGRQPEGLEANPLGAWLLAQLLTAAR